ncbi:MAG: energy transducer TonB [Gemmatimonadota bacterium]|nr:MAG: energy transducer TonB [Gemmatimonadota bacterium]
MASERIGQRVRREREVWRLGLLLSVLFHLILLLLSNTVVDIGRSAAGPARGSALAAPGEDAMVSVVLPPRTEIWIPPRPEIPLIDPVEVEVPFPEMAENWVELRPPQERVGPGVPGGEGSGAGGDASEGNQQTIPIPKGIIMAPLDRPRSVRGHEVTVHVLVNAAGVVESVYLDPPTPDGGYNEALIREARDWVFAPAVRQGQPVAMWTSYTWRL